MNIKYAILTISLLLAACAPPKEQTGDLHNYQVDKAFQPIVDTFEKEADSFGHPVKITNLIAEFGDTTPSGQGKVVDRQGNDVHVAYCDASGPTPKIVVNLGAWNNSTDSMREEILTHEMGHCILGLEHDNRVDADGHPLSLMFWQVIDPDYYEAHRSYYFSTLFSHYTAVTP